MKAHTPEKLRLKTTKTRERFINWHKKSQQTDVWCKNQNYKIQYNTLENPGNTNKVEKWIL